MLYHALLVKHQNEPLQILDWGQGREVCAASPFPQAGPVSFLSCCSALGWEAEFGRSPQWSTLRDLRACVQVPQLPYAVPFTLKTLPLAFPMPPSSPEECCTLINEATTSSTIF